MLNMHGKDLMDFCKNRIQSGITYGEQAIVARRMLTALCYLHDTLNLLHRDIKCVLPRLSSSEAAVLTLASEPGLKTSSCKSLGTSTPACWVTWATAGVSGRASRPQRR